MNLRVEEIIEAAGAKVIKALDSSIMLDISTDSRKVNDKNLYLPLKGEKFDGADFIDSALNNGARGYFCSDEKLADKNADYIFLVEDTKTAYLKIANFYKRKVNPVTIAITGSSGKTTTKEMMYSVISEKFKTHKSPLNYNNEIGLCQTLLSMPEDTEVLIVEMGMRGLLEIYVLSECAEPDIAVITNIGSAHIGRLGNLKNIARAKLEIVSHLHPEGLLIANDNILIKKNNHYEGVVRYFGLKSKHLNIIELNSGSSVFEYKGQKYVLNIDGEHNIEDSLAVIEAASKLGISPHVIARGLEKFKQIEKRWEFEKVKGFNIINDSYNANPESVRAAVKTFLKSCDSPKGLVLGDMGELGINEEKYHREIGTYLRQFDFDFLVTVGKLAKTMRVWGKLKNYNFDNNKEAAHYIAENIPEGSNILFKASRSMKLEEIIEELKTI